jgi:hypothetical protein
MPYPETFKHLCDTLRDVFCRSVTSQNSGLRKGTPSEYVVAVNDVARFLVNPYAAGSQATVDYIIAEREQRRIIQPCERHTTSPDSDCRSCRRAEIVQWLDEDPTLLEGIPPTVSMHWTEQ